MAEYFVRMRVEPSTGVTGITRSQPGTRGVRFSHRGASLGLKFKSTSDVISQLDRGFPSRALEALAANSGLALKDLAAAIGISSRTLARRRTTGCLRTDESERLLRIACVFEKTVDFFEGDVAASIRWLTTPQRALAGELPLRYSRMEPGAEEVKDILGRLEDGVFL